MAATLDGLVKETGAVFEAKFMLPWSFSEEAAADKHMAQLQHNMLVAGTKKSVLSIINGGGKWVELSIEADPIYQTILMAAERAFCRAVKTGALAVRLRASEAADRSGPGGRHEWFQLLGGVCSAVLRNPRGSRRTRAGQERAQGADAGGCQGGNGPRCPGETLQIGRGQLRSGPDGGLSCIAQVKASPQSPRRWRKPRPNSLQPREGDGRDDLPKSVG